MLSTRLAAIAAFSFIAVSIAQASPVTQFCGDRVCSFQKAEKPLKFAHRAKAYSAKSAKSTRTSRQIKITHRGTANQEFSYLPHPTGCPSRAFCACGAAVRVFGSPIRSLWPSSAWYKFPRSAPSPGTVAVRRGHVFVLESHVSGRDWLVSDYNSGGHQSRRHVRSINGYTIVNPHGRNFALN